MISIVIPVRNLHEITDECIDCALTYAHQNIEVIVVDNNSDTPYVRDGVKVIRNKKNAGFFPSLLQGIERASNDIVLTIHNDCFIWEEGFDIRLDNHFEQDDKLAIAGFFGARGLASNGARMFCESNMVGKKYGTPGNLHGNYIAKSHPSTIFDSYSMCFNRNLLKTIDCISIVPHHFSDRLVCTRLLKAGYHARTIGIAHDHAGGFTSSTVSMNTFTEDWCRERNLPMIENWDTTLYKYGEAMFRQEFLELTQGKHELWVQSNYTLQTR